MARSHARLLCAIWRDPEWTALTPRAQWLYLLLLSQQNLTLVGSLDVTTGKWATLAQGATREAVETALGELEHHRFVIVDRSTDELLIRSFTRHDLDPSRCSAMLVKGMVGQWGAIASAELRHHAVHEMPENIWEKVEKHAPPDMVKNRRSAPLERATPPPLESESPSPPESPPSSLLPPLHQQPEGEPVPSRAEPEPAHTPELRRQRVMEAARLVAQERADIRGDVGPGWVASTAQGIAKDHHQALHAHLAKNPTATALELVEEVIEARPTVVEVPTAVLPPPVADVLADQPPENFDGCREAVKHLRRLRSNPAAGASQVVSSAAHVIPAKETL